MNINYHFSRQPGGTIQVEMDQSLFLQFQKFAAQEQQKMEYNQRNQFNRKLIPFFMNQFYNWTKVIRVEIVRKYLEKIKKSKQSKQKKFELGDLKMIYQKNSELNIDEQYLRQETQKYWESFLKGQAEESVLQNKDIQSEISKQLYIQSIPLLISELEEIYPYEGFLSKFKNKKNVIQDVDYFFESSYLTQ